MITDPTKLLKDLVDQAATPGIATDIGGIPNDLTAVSSQTQSTTTAKQGTTPGSTKPSTAPGK